MKMKIPIERWSVERTSPAMEAFLRAPAVDPAADASAREVLAAIQEHGDEAVARYTLQFNGQRLAPRAFLVTPEEFAAARRAVDRAFVRAAKETIRRVTAFARASLRPDWSMPSPRGGRLGERFVPLDRVGVYVPGGVSPLASTVLMTVPLARVAGVKDIVACTPADAQGRINPYILYAMEQAGVGRAYRLGGMQAIGAMAYGTRTVPRVDKIVGPGGPYVTAAKRLVYGQVSLDMVAGPSEVAVLADDTAKAEQVAADLLSQAEHGTGHERTLLVTPCPALAEAVRDALGRQAASLERHAVIRTVLEKRTRLAVVPSLEDGMALINRFAPEHLELLVRQPRRWIKKVRHAGAIFVGPWTPECAGDFAVGPSHVLPTGGTARFFSGLTVEDFRRRLSVMELTRRDLEDVAPTIEAFARVEKLEAHARSCRARFGAL